MTETQNIEYKESWRDEYLKWICGFANAQGGRIYIGVKDDGTVVGVEDSRKLMEDIPNKIQNILGFVADVNLLNKDGMDYIEIMVSPQEYPVDYNGQYHYRSGSTKQLLRGNSLTSFLMKKTGIKWESAVVPNIAIEDLDKESFDIFKREALRSGRMDEESLKVPREELLEKLGLLSDGHLTRAGVLCFYREPERIIGGCYIKVGLFEGSEILYQDEIRGSLLLLADRAVDFIYWKYLKAKISYHKETRVETYPYAREAVREAVYNALIHCDWSANVPIQIRIDANTLSVGNCCILPQDWTVENLMGRHNSVPFNPTIADVFYRAGYIESWGRGIKKICDACEGLGADEPEYQISGCDIMVTFKALPSAIIDEPLEAQDGPLESMDEPKNGGKSGGKNVPNVTKDVTKEVPNVTKDVTKEESLDTKILTILKDRSADTTDEIANTLNVSRRTVQRKLDELRENGYVSRVGGRRYGHWEVR
ncbi:MAG: putative DNA binding domain-containing protein [Clostridiales bacterium]|nr:putative DNA binding domain-containing protein [Clostridiales bacterium]